MADNRDWDKEMAAIDQVIAKGGYVAPSGAGAPAVTSAGGGAVAPSAAPGGRRAWIGMWARTLLMVALAAGITVWPWTRFCGFRLYWFLTADLLLALTALWVMGVSWRRRSGLFDGASGARIKALGQRLQAGRRFGFGNGAADHLDLLGDGVRFLAHGA